MCGKFDAAIRDWRINTMTYLYQADYRKISQRGGHVGFMLMMTLPYVKSRADLIRF